MTCYIEKPTEYVLIKLSLTAVHLFHVNMSPTAIKDGMK